MFSLIVRSISREGGMTKCISSSSAAKRAWMRTKSSELPWLMLPPAIDSKMAYKFYSLAEKKVIMKNGVSDDDVGLVGSSHGWLVLHKKRNHNLFLYNPVSCRRIELPSIRTVPDKVIISSDICSLAIMCVKEMPTFCVPGRSTLWTDLNLNHNTKDFIYSSRHKFLFCERFGKIESWDLTDPRSPRMVWQTNMGYYNPEFTASYLVFAEQSDELFLVKRHMIEPGRQTIGFDVFMIDDWVSSGKLRYVEGSFNGLSLFVGANNSFALPAAEFPDSIYFTDDNKHSDIRIYNYQSRTITISPCYYPSDDAHSSTCPLPAVWFTPCTAAVSKPLIKKKIIPKAVSKPLINKKKITPWMLLPPLIREGNNMVYKFYSLADNKVKIVDNKRGQVKVSAESVVIPVECDECGVVRFLGSSQGWLALQDMHNKELFLSNPISQSHNHIKLPPIHGVQKLIFSGSPDDEEEVCAMVIFDKPPDTSFALAFCVPGRSTEWTRLGPCALTKTYGYQDFVYSSRHKLFFCVDFFGRIESWDLADTASPRIEWSGELKDMGLNHYSRTIQSEQGLRPLNNKYLAFDDQSNQLFLVIQRIRHIGPGLDKSAGFDVYKIDEWEGGGRGRLRYMDGSLNGISLFIGANNGFALSAAEFPGVLKPDSIYYSTTCHDLGIFNYQDETLSLCTYFQCDDKLFTPSPLWFTPPSLP